MFEFFRSLVAIVAPVFVVSTMLNVGLTQTPSDIIRHLNNYPFVLKMLLANFVLAPVAMIVVLTFTSFDAAIRDGLLIFALCAGGPFLIKLTQMAERDVALAAALMLVLIGGTAIYVPIVLPMFMYEVDVDAPAIAKTLFLQMVLPIAGGMLAVESAAEFAKAVQPWVGRLGNLALTVLIAATLIGYFPHIVGVAGTGAMLVALAFVAAAFGIGYVMGGGQDHLEEVGGFGTAQRNTSAGVIIATQNFDDRNVLVILTVASMLGFVMLFWIAKMLAAAR